MDYNEIKEKMQKTINVYSENLAEVRAGRANPAILNKIKIDYYGVQTPISQVAGISVPEARLIVIQPWDTSVLKEIEKEILKSDIGINPNNDGKVIRLSFPELNEERRKEIVKEIRKMAEEAKIAVRATRRDSIDNFRKMQKDSEYELFKKDIEKTYPYAIAMEMVHTFSLIHDDLPGIDNDDYRRGKLTNHKKFNEATAILAGDSLLNNAYNIIINDIITTKEDSICKLQAFKEFSNGIDRMIAGEYVDTEYEGKQISSQYLEYMHENKTGALIKASVRIGAILANSSQENINKLTKYAQKIGLAFQIKDDILSEIGDEKELGKPVGNDREKGKCTYVTKYGLETSKKMLNNLIREAIEIIEEYENNEFLKNLALYIANRNK